MKQLVMDPLARFARVRCFEVTKGSRFHAGRKPDLPVQPLERRLVHDPLGRCDFERMTQLVAENDERGSPRHRTRDFDEHIPDGWPR
jgi:hypothetical protein